MKKLLLKAFDRLLLLDDHRMGLESMGRTVARIVLVTFVGLVALCAGSCGLLWWLLG